MTATGQTTRTLAAIWDRIDRVYCISLAERPDRQADVRKQFDRVGLGKKVIFHCPRRHPTDCEQGIFESHQTCLKMGIADGARNILVFEDDVLFGHVNAERLEQGIAFFMNTKGCRILFLGCLAAGSWATDTPGVRRVRYRCLAHAYLVERPLARQLAAAPWTHTPYDILLKKSIGESHALYPSIAFQSNSPSDNRRHRILESVRLLLGGLKTIQMANERYHRFRYAIIAAHLLVTGAMIYWILL